MNFKKCLVVLSTLTSLGLAHAAYADGAYVQGQFGAGAILTQKVAVDNNPVTEMKRGGAAGRIAGGYAVDLNPQFSLGAELGYETYSPTTYQANVLGISQSLKYSGYNVDLLGVAKYHFSNNANHTGPYMVGKAGLARVHQKAVYSLQGRSIEGYRKNAIKPKASLGVGYDLNQNLSLDVSYDRVFAGKANPLGSTDSEVLKVSSTNALMAGLTYRFG